MKLKEAIKILQDFQTVAGEDAQCDLGELRLVSGVSVQYYDRAYSYSREEKSRGVTYSVIGYRDIADKVCTSFQPMEND